MFEYLPLAAVIEDKILCLHGGIGSTLQSIEQIEALPRPLEVIHEVSNEQ
jgi:protein phosphatase